MTGSGSLGQFSIQWHDRSADLPAALWRGCFTPPAERLWWYAALESAGLEDQFRFYYGEIRDAAGAAVGIVPAFVMDVPMDLVAPPAVMKILRALGPLGRPFMTQRTLFIGNVAGEGGTIGLLPSVAIRDVAGAVHAAARRLRREAGAKLVVWKDFPIESCEELTPTLAAAGYFRLPSYPATRILLPAGGVEAYLKALSQDYRYKLRKKLKASRAATPLKVAVHRQPDAATLAEIWGLFWQTYEHGGTKFERFNPTVFDRFAAHDDSHWLTLIDQTAGKMVAFMLLTREGDHWVNRFIGLDYAAPKELFLYYRLFVEAVDYCSADPLPFLLSGQTGYRAKIELGHELLPLDNFTKHRNPIMHAIYAAIAKGIDWSSLDPELAVYLKAHPEADRSRPASVHDDPAAPHRS